MAELMIITGPPGAGKSTVAAIVANTFDHSALVAGDQFFGFLARGYISPWLTEANYQNDIVTQAAAAAAGRLVIGGYHVVFDGVIGPWFLPTFLTAAGLDRLHYVVLMPSEECCVQRVQQRAGHGFTDIASTRHMHRQFADARIDDQHVLANPADQPEATAMVIQDRITDGSLIFG
ncbi:MAG: AAA family ATPase [Pseudonocardiaceae bacterium]